MAFIPLAKQGELVDGTVKRCRWKKLDLLVVQSAGQLYVIDNCCPHDGAALRKGTVAQGCIRCPKHRIVFDLKSGQALGGEAVAGIPLLCRYEPIVQGDDIGIQFTV